MNHFRMASFGRRFVIEIAPKKRRDQNVFFSVTLNVAVFDENRTDRKLGVSSFGPRQSRQKRRRIDRQKKSGQIAVFSGRRKSELKKQLRRDFANPICDSMRPKLQQKKHIVCEQ